MTLQGMEFQPIQIVFDERMILSRRASRFFKNLVKSRDDLSVVDSEYYQKYSHTTHLFSL